MNEQDMQVFEIIVNGLINIGRGVTTEKVLEKAKALDISEESTQESIRIIYDSGHLDATDLGHNSFLIKGLSPSGIRLYSMELNPDYESQVESIACHIANTPKNDSDSISNALGIELFIVNNALKELQARNYLKLKDATTVDSRNQYCYIVSDISPALIRECKGKGR